MTLAMLQLFDETYFGKLCAAKFFVSIAKSG